MPSKPPTEFRIFAKGINRTYKGDFLFDDKAALMVMAEYEEHGVDRPIDLEHLSIDQESNAYDPDARGWFKLQVRDGELWAVDVRWTPDGEKRLTQAKQRYISPFFGFNKKTRRVESLYNVAICAIPATKDMPALVAASARSKLELAALSIEANDMDMKKILAALGLGEDGTLEDALGAIKAYQEDGDKDEGKEQMKKLRKMLKLADDSPFEDVEAALKKLSVGGGDEDAGDKDPKRVVEQEASDDLNEDEKELAKMSAKVRGKFLALSSNVATLTKRLEKIERTQTVNEVEKLIADNTDKIPLHMEPFLRKQGAETVREFLKHAITSPRATPPKQKTNGGTEVTLTKEEKELAKLSGVTPEAQLQAKKERVERERAQQSQAD